MESEPPSPGYLAFTPLLLAIEPTGFVSALLGLIVLLISSALVSGSEVAFFSLSPSDIDTLRSDKSKASETILELKSRPRELLATILISNNFINIGIVILSEVIVWAVFSESTFSQWGNSIVSSLQLDASNVPLVSRIISFSITVVGATMLLVLFGEITPKIYASIHNLSFAKFMSLPMKLLNKILSPISRVMVRSTSYFENKFDIKNIKSTRKEDLDAAIDLTVNFEQNSEEEVDILKGILKFNDVPVKQVMCSRVDIVGLEKNLTFTEVLKIVKSSGFSRLPVYLEELDEIVGILYAKDLLKHLGKSDDFKWQKLIRTNVLYVPESKKINDLLKEFQLKKSHMAIVVDEYGGNEGLVTLEDVMEEVIGEVKDEFNDFDDVDYEKLDDWNYSFEGKTLLNDVSRIIGKDTSFFDELRGDSDSIAGFILEIIGYMPKVESEMKYRDIKFKILKVNKRRIERIKLTIIEANATN